MHPGHSRMNCVAVAEPCIAPLDANLFATVATQDLLGAGDRFALPFRSSHPGPPLHPFGEEVVDCPRPALPGQDQHKPTRTDLLGELLDVLGELI